MAIAPLSGIRVLDFTAFPPGAICSVMLADLGAEVIRVEPPALKGKPSTVFGQMAMSRAKRSMTLDMRDPRSAEILLRMTPKVDVIVENAKPGSMEKRGFGYSHARNANQRVIWCAITGFGQSGPYAQHAGHDISYVAHSGLLGALSKDPSFQPGIQLAVTYGAMAAVVGIQSALLDLARSGNGSFVDISLSEAATWVLTGGINPLSDDPLILPPSPDRRMYECADGRRVAVACAEPRTWKALCDGLELPELEGKLHGRSTATADAEAIAAAFRTRPAAEWVDRLAPLGAAVTIANHGAELLEDAQVKARGTVVQVDGVPVPACPVHLERGDGESSTTNASPPHLVGADTEAILMECGFNAGEIEELAETGLV